MTRLDELDHRIATLRDSRKHMLTAQRWWARMRPLVPDALWLNATLRLVEILHEMAEHEERLKHEAAMIRASARVIAGVLWN